MKNKNIMADIVKKNIIPDNLKKRIAPYEVLLEMNRTGLRPIVDTCRDLKQTIKTT